MVTQLSLIFSLLFLFQRDICSFQLLSLFFIHFFELVLALWLERVKETKELVRTFWGLPYGRSGVGAVGPVGSSLAVKSMFIVTSSTNGLNLFSVFPVEHFCAEVRSQKGSRHLWRRLGSHMIRENEGEKNARNQ